MPGARLTPSPGFIKRRHFTAGQTIALFGGSFDPPHAGHRLLAEAALRQLQVDKVWWLPAPQNPLKNHQPGAMATRLAATERLARHPRFLVSDEESRLGTHYAIDTVCALQRLYPHVRFIWLIGSDNLQHMHRWRNWPALMQTVPLAVYPRPGSSHKAAFSQAAQRFAAYRVAAEDAPLLASRKAPAWCLLEGVTSPLASSALRRQNEH